MKNKICLTMLLVTLIAYNTQAQTVRRVSNALAAGAPFSTIQAAVNAAVDGDIILVEGSSANYTGAVTLTKRLTIQGPGYFLDQNQGLQTNSNIAFLNSSITFDAGSAGSILRGMRTGPIVINTSNITISNNFLGQGASISAAANNIIISGNYNAAGFISVSSTNATNLLITNNYIGSGINFANTVTVLGVVTNNILASGSNNLSNSTVAGNIFLATAINPINETSNATIQNNVFVSASQAGADATNVFGASSASLFVGLAGNTTDTQWKLKAGSPAIGAGVGGTDCGMYGGNNPSYRISGIATGQPTITNFTAPGTIPVNGTLNVKVSAKVN
jgi:hypothetical protein